jgi:hypothetical protein
MQDRENSRQEDGNAIDSSTQRQPRRSIRIAAKTCPALEGIDDINTPKGDGETLELAKKGTCKWIIQLNQVKVILQMIQIMMVKTFQNYK